MYTFLIYPLSNARKTLGGKIEFSIRSNSQPVIGYNHYNLSIMSNTAEKTKSDLVVMTIKEYCESKGFKQIVPAVRVNTNGYPFITFIDGNNEAENVYFSKAAANAVNAGTPVTKDMLKIYQIGVTTNAEGEERVKLITNSDRVDLSELL